MDVEKFINMVYEHKCLWDPSYSGYNLREIQRTAWQGISEEMEMPVDEVKKKWRGLRDTFGKELKKINDQKSDQAASTKLVSKWLYFKPLLFLRNIMSRRDPKRKLPSIIKVSDGEDSTNASSCSEYLPPSPPPAITLKPISLLTHKKIFESPKKKVKRRQADEIDTRLLQTEEEKAKCCQESGNDPDIQFLMSLLPFLKDIPKHRKLTVRAKLQQVFIDEQNTTEVYDNSSVS